MVQVIFFDGTIQRSSIESWRTTFEVNVLGVVNTIKARPIRAGPHCSLNALTITSSHLHNGDANLNHAQSIFDMNVQLMCMQSFLFDVFQLNAL